MNDDFVLRRWGFPCPNCQQQWAIWQIKEVQGARRKEMLCANGHKIIVGRPHKHRTGVSID